MTQEDKIMVLKRAWENAEAGPSKDEALRTYQNAQDAMVVKTKVADAEYVSNAVDALDD